MKKSRALKSAALVALSAVLVGGVAMAAAGCGGDANQIVVNMFSSTADLATNQKIADDWVAEYNEKNGTQYTVKIANQVEKSVYYDTLSNMFVKNTVGDVIYIAPRNVNTFAKSGRVVDLTPYLVDDATAVENIQKVWPAALNYYGYDTSKVAYSNNAYTMGQHISYQADGAGGKGFYTDDGEKVGLYGLPKDYSNFSMGYNRVFFSDAMKTAYTTTKVNANRNVYAAQGDTDSNSTGEKNAQNLKYTSATGMDGSTPVIRYAVTDRYTNPVTNQTVDAVENQPANIINIGVPVKIKPFNFYMWKDYATALNAGDPIAIMVDIFTGGDGYTVTLPGFPDGTFEITDAALKDPEAPYNTSMGHVVYTYAEYGALLWSLTYYLNTFAWDTRTEPTNTDMGGVRIQATATQYVYRTVYGGEQYEGGQQDGAQLYLLPWLFSNDADLIDLTNMYCTSSTSAKNNETLRTEAKNINLTDLSNWVAEAGTATNTVSKLRLNGTSEDVEVQYGLNSQKFIETYAAFLAIGSDWNGNPNDSPTTNPESSGWGYFRDGRSIFYGAGTWDSATRNEEDKAKVDLGQMPTPVAERYALYSSIKDANYYMVTYSNYTNNPKGTDVVKGANAAALAEGLQIYDKTEIEANLTQRQDKWGARMDSVGYAVTKKAVEGGAERAKAAASLCAALTISEKPQISLTYGGAQLPNFVSQCEELLGYQSDEYKTTGAFKDMITPDGSATVKNTPENPTAGTDLWNQYYEIAKQLGDAAFNGNGNLTVAEFLADKKVNGQPVSYDPDFANTKLDPKSFASADSKAKSRYSFAMKILRMVAFREKDFDLLIRMQYGLNSVRDSSMYTYRDTWLDPHDARSMPDNMLAYYRAQPLVNSSLDTEAVLKRNPASTSPHGSAGGYDSTQYLSPFVFCMLQADQAQKNLTAAIEEEVRVLYN